MHGFGDHGRWRAGFDAAWDAAGNIQRRGNVWLVQKIRCLACRANSRAASGGSIVTAFASMS